MATKKTKVRLFIEGSTDDTNGDLRQGFIGLLRNVPILTGKMPSIVLGGGVRQTIDKFSNASHTYRTSISADSYEIVDMQSTSQ